MSSKMREALEKFSEVDLSKLKFPLDGDSTTIYNSDKEEITIPYWRVADLLNEIKVAQDMAKAAIAIPLRNCDVGTVSEQDARFDDFCDSQDSCVECPLKGTSEDCVVGWLQMPY